MKEKKLNKHLYSLIVKGIDITTGERHYTSTDIYEYMTVESFYFSLISNLLLFSQDEKLTDVLLINEKKEG